jgi:hypothetical protein
MNNSNELRIYLDPKRNELVVAFVTPGSKPHELSRVDSKSLGVIIKGIDIPKGTELQRDFTGFFAHRDYISLFEIKTE